MEIYRRMRAIEIKLNCHALGVKIVIWWPNNYSVPICSKKVLPWPDF